MDWRLAEENTGLLRFTRMMIALRKKYFALSREQFINRVTWHGIKVGDPDWTGMSRTLAFQLHGLHRQPDFFVLFNAHWEWQKFMLPPHAGQLRWHRLIDTNLPTPEKTIVEGSWRAVRVRPVEHYNAALRLRSYSHFTVLIRACVLARSCADAAA